jgi:WD40 repeat protein
MPNYDNPLLQAKYNPAIRKAEENGGTGWDFSGFAPAWYDKFRGTIFTSPLERKKQIKLKPQPKQKGIVDLEEVIHLEIPKAINDLEFSPDGTFLAVASEELMFYGCDLPGNNVKFLYQFNPSGQTMSVAFSPDSRLVALADDEHYIQISRFKRTGPFTPEITKKSATMILGLDFTPDSRHLVREGNSRVSVDEVVMSAENIFPYFSATQSHTLQDLAISPDGRNLALCQNHNINIYRLDMDRKRIRSKAKHAFGGRVLAADFSPDSRHIAVACNNDHAVRILSFEQNSGMMFPLLEKKVYSHVFALSFSPDGRYLAVGQLDGALDIFQVKTA